MKILLAIVFIFCFYSFFYYIKVGYDFLKDLKGETDIFSQVRARYDIKRQKSQSSFINNINFLLYTSFAFIIFSGWLVYELYPWWVILITVLLGNFISNSRKIEPALFREQLAGAKKTFFAGLVVVIIICIVWLVTKS